MFDVKMYKLVIRLLKLVNKTHLLWLSLLLK